MDLTLCSQLQFNTKNKTKLFQTIFKKLTKLNPSTCQLKIHLRRGHIKKTFSHSLKELFSGPYLLKLPKMNNAVDILETRTLTVKLVDRVLVSFQIHRNYSKLNFHLLHLFSCKCANLGDCFHFRCWSTHFSCFLWFGFFGTWGEFWKESEHW